jgi:hypothetical protein
VPTNQIAVDYLVIGAGATAMAFADVMVTEGICTLAIVDRGDVAGGHWAVSYPFVRLHGASNIYGVNSQPMASDVRDLDASLASRHEILDYYDRVMHETLVSSGRATYLPRHEVEEVRAAGPVTVAARSLVTGRVCEIVVGKRVVDASYMNITVPAMRAPEFEVAPDATVIPINQLASLAQSPARFAVIGSGKTGIDACLWLLGRGVEPTTITWISPRDAWLIKRATRVRSEDISPLFGLTDCESVDEAIDKLEEMGFVMRRDPARRPTAFRCATVNDTELVELRSIEDVVHLGRVRRVSATGVELDEGSLTMPPGTVYVDCTADGLTQKPLTPVFADGRITLQPLLPCLLPVSAAITAKLDCQELDDELRNGLARPVLNPNQARDLVDFFRIRVDRVLQWAPSPYLGQWLIESRLGAGLSGLVQGRDPETRAEISRLEAHLAGLLKEEA